MKMTLRPNTYKTVFLLTILTLGIMFAVYPIPIGALNTPVLSETEGCVGDDDVIVSGTGAAPFGKVSIYWDKISDDTLLTTETANSAGSYKTSDGDFEIPEDVAGNHWIIVTDGQTLNNGTIFTIIPKIVLDPEEGLPDDYIEVTGTGFGKETDITIFFDWEDDADVDEDDKDVTPSGGIETDENGTFVADIKIPDVDEDKWPVTVIIHANGTYPMDVELGSSGDAEAGWTSEAHSGNYAVSLATLGTPGWNGTHWVDDGGDEGRIVITLPPGTTLGDIETISWWTYLVSGYVPHVDLVLDYTGDGERDDVLTAEGAHQNDPDGAHGWTTGTWTQTFEGATGEYTSWSRIPESQTPDDLKSVQNKTAVWMIAADDPIFGLATLANFKEGKTDGTIEVNSTTIVLALEIEIDNWVLQTEAYIDDITVNDDVYELELITSEADAELLVGQYITVDPDYGYPGFPGIEYEGRAEANEDYEIRFHGADLWKSLANITTDSKGAFDGTFTVPIEAEPGDGPEPYWGRKFDVELYDDDDLICSTTFKVYPEPVIETASGAKANATVKIYGGFFYRWKGTDVDLSLNGIDIDTFETDKYGNFSDKFDVPDIAVGHYTLTAVDEKGFTAETDFDVLPEAYAEFGTRESIYLQGDKFSFWSNLTEPDFDGIYLNITDVEGVRFYEGEIKLGDFQSLEGEYADYFVLPYNAFGDLTLPDDAKIGTWNWMAVEVENGDKDDDVWAEGTFDVIDKITVNYVLDRLDEIDATITGLITDTEGNLMAYIDTKMGIVTASLADLNATVVTIEGNVATIATDLGTVKADVADIADEFPLEIPDVDLTPMWAAVALSLIAAIAAIAAVVVVYQRIA